LLFASHFNNISIPLFWWQRSMTHSLLAFTLVLHHILSIIFLKPTVSTRPSVSPSGSHKYLKIRPLVVTVQYKGFYLFTYLLTYFTTTIQYTPDTCWKNWKVFRRLSCSADGIQSRCLSTVRHISAEPTLKHPRYSPWYSTVKHYSRVFQTFVWSGNHCSNFNCSRNP